MSHILVVGSLAYDTISTIKGKVCKTLGGSANYFSVTASRYCPVSVIGIVGEDYTDENMALLSDRDIDISGIQKDFGKTFHWEGAYKEDMNTAITLNTELAVFAKFNPILNENCKKADIVFLANIDPDLQLKVLEQVENPKVIALDTMDFWIRSKRESLLEVIKRVDILILNEEESLQLTYKNNSVEAVKELANMDVSAVVIKRGSYGFMLYAKEKFFILPSFPVTSVVDPTGAGDTFAGGLIGYLAKQEGDITFETLKGGCIDGTILASYTIEDFGLKKLCSIVDEDIYLRQLEYKKIVSI